MTERPDLAALLADPSKVSTVAADEVPMLLDALAVEEGRCRQVRDLLTRRRESPIGTRPESGFEWIRISEAAETFSCSVRTVHRRMRDGTWKQGEHWFAQNGTEPRLSRTALDAWQRRVSAAETPPTSGLAFSSDVPRGRRRRAHLQNVAQQL
jgi:hypothetical protein